MENITLNSGTDLLAFAGYRDFEAAADKTAVKIKEGYMEMGYILKMARDTDILAGSGYTDHEDFADRRYGLDKGTVSRYIRIVERFSKGGNSHILKESYKNMGFSKLSLMLHMPDEVAEELMDSLSKAEIQAIKEEIDAENAVTDMEIALERASLESISAENNLQETGSMEENAGGDLQQADCSIRQDMAAGSLLDRAVLRLGEERPQLYLKLWDPCHSGEEWKIKDILAPQGDAVYMVRPAGTGRLMLTVSDAGVSVTAVRSREKTKYSMDDLLEKIKKICPADEPDAGSAYRRIYGADLQLPELPVEKTEVAPVQSAERNFGQKAEKKPKKEKRKESKVIRAVTEKPAPEEDDIQIPGQTDIEHDFPEYLPAGTVPKQDLPAAGFEEIVPGTENQQQEADNGNRIKTAGYDNGTPESAGNTGDDRAPGDDAGGEEKTDSVREHDAGVGAPAGRGREADHGGIDGTGLTQTESENATVKESVDEIWADFRESQHLLNTFAREWLSSLPLEIPLYHLESAYHNAVSLAADLEKFMIVRNQYGKINHAQ